MKKRSYSTFYPRKELPHAGRHEGHQEIPLFRAKQGRVQKNKTAMNKKVTERSV